MNVRIRKPSAMLAIALCSSLFAVDAAALADRAPSARDVRACVDTIDRRADYGEASRVQHWVRAASQLNMVMLSLEIDTTVYGRGDDNILRRYTTVCVTGQASDVARFHMSPLSRKPAA